VWLNYNNAASRSMLRSPPDSKSSTASSRPSTWLWENFTPGAAQRLGLGYDDLRAINPRLIYCSISGYGQSGPYMHVKAYDLLIQGEAGIIATTGSPDEPAKVSVPIADLACSMYAVTAILTALYQRTNTGRGQYIDISMFESILAWQGYFLQHYWHQGEEPPRVGARHHYVTPYGPFLAGDGVYVSFAVATAPRLGSILPPDYRAARFPRRPALFQTTELRRKNRVDLERTVEEIFLQHRIPNGWPV